MLEPPLRPIRQPGTKPWSLASEPNHAIPLHVEDVWHFEYFRVVCTKELSLYLGTGLWETLVLRAAFTERCILHGVLALGALSRNTVPSSVSRQPALSPGFLAGYSLGKYNLAIRELNRRITASPSSWQLAVLGSMIFIAIESLQRNHDVVKMHLQGALAIWQSHKDSGSNSAQTISEMAHVLNAFSRLGGQSLGLAKQYILTLLQIPAVPLAFTNISEARDTLSSIHGAMNSLFWKETSENPTLPQLPLSPALVQDLSTLLNILESWHALFAKFVGEHDMDAKTTTCVKILLVYHKIVFISASTYFYFSQTAYDAYLSDFSYIIDLATEILQAEHVGRAIPIRSDPCYTFDIATVQPLFFVACKCRDSLLRKRAIEAMEKIKGAAFYDTELLARVARCVVTIEESTSSAVGVSPVKVKEQDRLQDIQLSFGTAAQTCRVTAWKRQGDGGWQEVDFHLHTG